MPFTTSRQADAPCVWLNMMGLTKNSQAEGLSLRCPEYTSFSFLKTFSSYPSSALHILTMSLLYWSKSSRVRIILETASIPLRRL